MAIAIVQSVRLDQATAGTNASGTFASAPAQGSLIVACVVLAFSVLSPPTETTQSGWTKVKNSAALVSTAANAGLFYWKKAGASEPTTQTPTIFSTALAYSIVLFEISGANVSSPIEFAESTGTGGDTTGTFSGTPAIYTSPSHIPTQPSELTLFLGYFVGSAATSIPTAPGYTVDFWSLSSFYAVAHSSSLTSDTTTSKNIVITYPGSTSTSADFEGIIVFINQQQTPYQPNYQLAPILAQ